MKTDVAKKSSIITTTQEQKENLKNTRRTLKDLQQAVDNKENLAGRPGVVKDSLKKDDKKKIKLMNKAVQTEEIEVKITAEDLTAEEPSEDYWRRLAEKRGDALNDSLQENERLKENIELLQEENRICKEMLDESKNLVEVLQEMLNDSETSAEVAEEATET